MKSSGLKELYVSRHAARNRIDGEKILIALLREEISKVRIGNLFEINLGRPAPVERARIIQRFEYIIPISEPQRISITFLFLSISSQIRWSFVEKPGSTLQGKDIRRLRLSFSPALS